MGSAPPYARQFFRPSPRRLAAYLRGLPGTPHDALTAQLQGLYAGCCPTDQLPRGNQAPQLAGLLDEIVQYIYSTKGLGMQIDPRLISSYAGRLWQAIQEGYGRPTAELGPDAEDIRMLESLRTNVWQFSAAKSYTQLRALGNALIGEDGKLLTWEAFRKAAYAINSEHVGPWLHTEYDTAVQGAQMAGKWVGFRQDGVSLLEFDAVMDNKTTQTCRELNGVVKPVNDPFWRIYYPPNHYLCRSNVRAVYGRAITPDARIKHPDIPSMFKTNLGDQGLVFPKDHPYFNGLPDQVRQQADKLKNDERPDKGA